MDKALEEARFAKDNGACGIFVRGLEGDKRLSDSYFFPLYEAAGRLDDVLFGDETHADAFRALESADTLQHAIASCDPAAAALLQQLAVEESDTDADEVVARVAYLAAARTLNALETEAKASDDPISYLPDLGWLNLTMERLREPEARVDAAAQLVAWLRDRVEEQEHA